MPSLALRFLSGRPKRALALMGLGLIMGMAMILAVPRNMGLWGHYPVVQLDALPLAWITVLVVCIFCASIALRGTSTESGPSRIVLQIMTILLISAVLIEGTLFFRAGGFLPAEVAAAEIGRGDLTVLSFNARDTEALDVARAAVDSQADAVLLVETSRDVAEEVVHRLQRQGMTNQLFMGSGTSLQGQQEVAVIVAEELGKYHEVAGPVLAFGAVTVAPLTRADTATGSAEPGGPMLSAVHPPAPVPGKIPASVWRQQLQTAVGPCRQEGAIVGGDFNASPRQVSGAMGNECIHAGTHLGRESVGTWPTGMPAPLGASIDHQITNGDYWEPVGIAFMNVGRSDHRAVAVTYRATSL